MQPRAVIVHRTTELTGLLHDHGTQGKADFFLETRGGDMTLVQHRHALQDRAMGYVLKAVPTKWRRVMVERSDLDRFLFEPGDIVVAVGQDGLVANTSKYLDGQSVVGINPDPATNAGVLVPHDPRSAGDVVRRAAERTAPIQERTMAEVTTDEGVSLVALNELFIGHRTHQSARYDLEFAGRTVFQSSSGLIVATGTGCTGWAASVHRSHRSALPLPAPTDPRLIFFVREAWPGPGCDVATTEGLVTPEKPLRITCRMSEGGVVFGDGIEGDSISLRWGQSITVVRAARRLRLVA
jgi:hypothetical protein